MCRLNPRLSTNRSREGSAAEEPSVVPVPFHVPVPKLAPVQFRFGPAASINCVGWIWVVVWMDHGNCQGRWILLILFLFLFMPLLLFLFLLLFSCDYLYVKLGPATSVKCVGWIRVCKDQGNCQGWWNLLCLFMPLLLFLFLNLLLFRCDFLDVKFGPVASIKCVGCVSEYERIKRTDIGDGSYCSCFCSCSCPSPVQSSFIDYPDSVKLGQVLKMNCTGGIWGQVRADRGFCKRWWILLFLFRHRSSITQIRSNMVEYK